MAPTGSWPGTASCGEIRKYILTLDLALAIDESMLLL